MAEKLFEELVAIGCPQNADFNRWLVEKLKSPSAQCTKEEFATFYFSLVKTQTDEFIKNNTSTCNTPRKMTITSDESVKGFINQTVQNDKRLHINNPTKQNSVDGSKEERGYRKQSSRELFSVQDSNITPLKSAFFYNRKSGSMESSTPVNNRSIDVTPTNTSSSHSFKNTKNSFSNNEQNSMTFRSSSRNSLDLSSRNTSVSKRNTTGSSLCLADFMNTSAVSSSGKGGKKRNSSHQSIAEQTPKFTNTDFPTLGEESSNDSKSQPKKSDNKPKKRVVPITISRKTSPGTSNFSSSSFQSDNNLLHLTGLESSEGVDILSERRKLCDQRNEISKDFTTDIEPQKNLHAIVRANLPAATQSTGSPRKIPSFQFDDSRVGGKELLTVMAKIYSFLIDMNLVPNILSEFTYLFNLLNTEHEPLEQLSSDDQNLNKSPIDVASNTLKNLHNCIFFVVCTLSCQKKTLALLDVMTLRVLIDNDRIQTLAVELDEHLRSIIQQKSQLDTSDKFTNHNGDNISKVVFYQQETDNRDNFPSDREFGAFKKQRDVFYSILRSWELKHLDQLYDFRKDLGLKIRSLINLNEHPINMAHLARLFTAQLIISCHFDHSANELQTVLPNIDLSKLSKLRQRLIAPSQFSTQYLFPGNQAFFRDFIVCSDHHMIFMDQLKISLISELMQMNNSSMETFCIAPVTGDRQGGENFREEFIVRAETMTTMRVLAKFVGFVVSRPYSYEGFRNTLIDQQQSQIRNALHPDFDVKNAVLKAIEGHKLLVTIPWLVDYLVMLDFITIRLDYYRELFQLLYTVYMRVNVLSDRTSLSTMPSSKFIIRVCLGWLFEHPEIPEEYCNFSSFKSTPNELEFPEVDRNVESLNSHLENIMNSACPFLADFRVSVMPQRTTKAVSRTGRYRHITTKIQDKSSAQKLKVQDDRERLIDAFLASQTLSVRKIVDFAIDRVTSAVVKDFQVKRLLTVRKEAKADVEQLVPSAIEIEKLIKRMLEIYQQHLKRLQEMWNEDVKKNCSTRIEGVFDSLLPMETLDEVKKTLINITFEKTNEKLHEWSATNIATVEVFSKDIQVDALKLKENQQQNGNKRTTSSIIIDLSAETMPSDYFKALQTLLHNASRHPENIQDDDLIKCVEMATNVLENQTLPSNAYRNIAYYMFQLVLQCIVTRPDLVEKFFLSKLYAMWRHKSLSIYTSKELQSEENFPNRRKVDDFVFSKVISSRFMLMMQGKSRQSFEVYADFLVDLVRENFISGEHINEQSVRLYQHEWTKEVLDNIAFLIHRIKTLLSSTPSESQLFMELVVDLARDMDNF